jgi:hypothetical protein
MVCSPFFSQVRTIKFFHSCYEACQVGILYTVENAIAGPAAANEAFGGEYTQMLRDIPFSGAKRFYEFIDEHFPFQQQADHKKAQRVRYAGEKLRDSLSLNEYIPIHFQ